MWVGPEVCVVLLFGLNEMSGKAKLLKFGHKEEQNHYVMIRNTYITADLLLEGYYCAPKRHDNRRFVTLVRILLVSQTAVTGDVVRGRCRTWQASRG